MSNKRIVGVSPWSYPDYDLMQAAGIEWVRMGFSFPFEDRSVGRLTEKFNAELAETRRVAGLGLRIMGVTPLAGIMAFDKRDGKTAWRPELPAWAGTPADESYYRAYETACEVIGELTRDVVEMWQVSNEMDIEVFRGPMTVEQAGRFMLAGAHGIQRTSPDSRPGINPAMLLGDGQRLFEMLYRIPGTPFSYAGIDGYFGSWAPGGPEDWLPLIEDIQHITGQEVLINEWGYSSLGGPVKPAITGLAPEQTSVCEVGAWHYAWRESHTPAEQTLYVQIALKLFATYPGVLGSFFYDWGDDPTCFHCGRSECPSECGWGLVDSAGKPKPAYDAFKEIIARYYQ